MANETMMSVEKYAAKHRLSIYTVIQKVNRGELPSTVEEKDGKKVTYVLLTEEGAAPAAQPQPGSQEEVDYKAAYEALQKEMAELREKAIRGE